LAPCRSASGRFDVFSPPQGDLRVAFFAGAPNTGAPTVWWSSCPCATATGLQRRSTLPRSATAGHAVAATASLMRRGAARVADSGTAVKRAILPWPVGWACRPSTQERARCVIGKPTRHIDRGRFGAEPFDTVGDDAAMLLWGRVRRTKGNGPPPRSTGYSTQSRRCLRCTCALASTAVRASPEGRRSPCGAIVGSENRSSASAARRGVRASCGDWQ
jgi:hypothetical protein